MARTRNHSHADPVGETAVGHVAKMSRARQIPNKYVEAQATVDFYVSQVRRASSLDVLGEIVKCLGTFAEIDSEISHTGSYENHEDEVAEFSHRISGRFANSEQVEATLKNWYYTRRSDLRTSANSAVRPLIMRIVSKNY